MRALRATRSWFLGFAFILILVSAAPVSAQDAREAGVVLGTTGLNIRSCPDVSCPSQGLAQLEDPIIVTGPPQDGFLPVQWAGKNGWAWHLYVATASTGTPFLEQGTPGCKRLALIFNIGIGEPLQIQALKWLKDEKVPATVFPMGWWALAFPDDMRTIAMLGFPIGSHGDVRLNLTGFADDEVATDVRDSAQHIRQVTGSEPDAYFTPYAADIDERVREIVAREGYLAGGVGRGGRRLGRRHHRGLRLRPRGAERGRRLDHRVSSRRPVFGGIDCGRVAADRERPRANRATASSPSRTWRSPARRRRRCPRRVPFLVETGQIRHVSASRYGILNTCSTFPRRPRSLRLPSARRGNGVWRSRRTA